MQTTGGDTTENLQVFQVAVNNKQTRVQTKVPVAVKPIELEGIHHTDHTDPLFSNQLGDLTKQTLELLLLS